MWNKILEAIVTGTAAATTWAALVWLYTFGRNVAQERAIKRSFARAGIGSGIYGFSVSLSNHTKKEVRVREVGLYTDSGTDVILSCTGTIEYDRKLDLKTLGAENRAMMFAPRGGRSEPTFPPELDIESQATWLMPNKACLDERLRPKGGYCIVDFQTLFGGRRALKVVFDQRASEDLGKQFDHHRNECLTNDFMKPYIK
jgi:hypothetical protein